MNTLNRPLATTKQFRAAVKQVAPSKVSSSGYTDRPRVSMGDKRYVKIYTYRLSKTELDSIEFVLWAQGVTANTRQCTHGVRGTCILSKE